MRKPISIDTSKDDPVVDNQFWLFNEALNGQLTISQVAFFI